MGGKKGAVLNSWIKEFCTLVFIQTIQAFIYAIIISVIVKMSFMDIADVDDRNSSIGIICVIALTSVFKVEEMVKKIFGIGNTKADARGAMSSLAKTAIAWQFGKKVLDNGVKMASGAKGIRDAAKGRAKLKQRMDRDRATFDDESDSSGALGAAQDPSKEYYDKALAAKAAGNMDGYRTNMGIAAGIKKAGNNGGSGSSPKSGKNTRDYNAMMDKYQDQLDELKKKKRDGIRQIIQGAGETAGALPGFVGGAIVGGADGNIDEALRGAAVGMGMGDTLGGSIATSTYDVGTTAASTYRDLTSSVAKLHAAGMQQQADAKGLKRASEYLSGAIKEANKNRISEKELQAIIKRANDARADNAN